MYSNFKQQISTVQNHSYFGTNLSILKSRDIALPTKVHLVMASNGFFQWSCIDVRVGPIIKKAEDQRIGASELWCCKKLLRVPWSAERSNQSILKAISPEYSLEGLN